LQRFWMVHGPMSEGREYLGQVLRCAGASEQTQARAKALYGAAILACFQCDYGSAKPLFEQALVINRKMGNRAGEANAIWGLGNVVLEQGDYGSAQALYEESLTIRRELADSLGIAYSLGHVAMLSVKEGRSEQAARLGGAAEALREVLGSRLPPNENEEYERNVAAAREALGEEVFAVAWEAGRAMTWEQAVAYALEEPSHA
jgi:tetratricopeptide (TPR) repeat protein